MLKKIDGFLNKINTPKRKQNNFYGSFYSSAGIIKLISTWEEVVGKKISEISLPQRITRNCLYIVVNHPTYANHLKLLQEEILEKIYLTNPYLKKQFNQVKFFFSQKAFKEQKTLDIYREDTKPKKIDPIDEEALLRKRIRAKEKFKDVDDDFREIFISLYVQASESDK